MKHTIIRILCVDDHAFLVDGLRTRFELEDDLECVGRLATVEALPTEAARLKPDIILLDVEMPGPDPFEAAAEVMRRCPGARIIMLSANVCDHSISAAFRAGVRGYFSKADEAVTIIEGIRTVAAGSVAMGPKVQAHRRPPPGRAAEIE